MARKRGSYSPEHRAAISRGMRCHHVSPETAEKISAALRDRPKSEEHRRKIGEGVRRAAQARAWIDLHRYARNAEH